MTGIVSLPEEQISDWERRLRRAEDRIRAVEHDLRMYRDERRVASAALARLRAQLRRDREAA